MIPGKDDLLARLDRFPRQPLGLAPTPLDDAANLAGTLGIPRLRIKRDDLTGLGLGGNKVRQLEPYFGAARDAGADVVLITGAVQSNYARLAAAAARKLGMDCHIQLEHRVPRDDRDYRENGNVLLDRLLGATLHSYPEGEDEAGADRSLGEIADGLRRAGQTPYVIPLGPGNPPKGALGYIRAAIELVDQIGAEDAKGLEIIVTSGSGITHAGLLFGLRALGCPARVTGICARRAADAQVDRIRGHCAALNDMLGLQVALTESDIRLDDGALAPGYGRAGDSAIRALELTAHSEGLFLDPVYTGKAMAGLIDRQKRGELGDNVVFWHTGGQPALFAYGEEMGLTGS